MAAARICRIRECERPCHQVRHIGSLAFFLLLVVIPDSIRRLLRCTCIGGSVFCEEGLIELHALLSGGNLNVRSCCIAVYAVP